MSTSARTLTSALLGLVLAALLSAASLVDAAERLELGPARRLAIAAVQPVLDLSQGLGLDLPGDWGGRWVKPWFSGRKASLVGWDLRRSGSADLPGASAKASASAPPPQRTALAPPPLVAPPAAPPCTPWVPPIPRPEAPLEVWFVGDSLLQFVESSLLSEQEQPPLFAHHFAWRYSTGLARPDYFDWSGRIAERLETGDPAAIVVMLGGNDGQAMSGASQVLVRETAGWVAEYRARAKAMAVVMASKGAEVFWIGLPVMRNRGMHRRAQLMNAAYAQAAAEIESVHYVDIWDLFADDQGRYTKHLKDPDGIRRVARGNDGIHLSRGGTRRLARRLDAVFAKTWDLDAWSDALPPNSCPPTEAVASDAH